MQVEERRSETPKIKSIDTWDYGHLYETQFIINNYEKDVVKIQRKFRALMMRNRFQQMIKDREAVEETEQ